MPCFGHQLNHLSISTSVFHPLILRTPSANLEHNPCVTAQPMGEFHNTVTSLLDTFSSSLAVIRRVRRRRKEAKVEVDPALKAEELRLRRSLKKSRADVQSAYEYDLARVGNHQFSRGDAKARSTLASILFHLKSGFVSIADRFTRGHGAPSDYDTLLHLSNSCRIKTLRSFEQLSLRLSQSSINPLSDDSRPETCSRKGRRKKATSSVARSSEIDSVVCSGNVTQTERLKQDTVRPSSQQHMMQKRPPKIKNKKIFSSKLPLTKAQLCSSSAPRSRDQAFCGFSDADKGFSPKLSSQTASLSKISVTSSSSTNIGEIPERRSVAPVVYHSEDKYFPSDTAFPLVPFGEQLKKRLGMRRIFGVPN